MTRLTSPVRVAILGASGYTGAELLRLLHGLPDYRIVALTAQRYAGMPVEAVFPHLHGMDLPALTSLEDLGAAEPDLVFCCLPHATAQPVIAGLPAATRVVDLSADFRLRDVQTYEVWYEVAHQAPALQAKAVYGLSEWYREAVREARLVANPGCYPTCALLPLLPLLHAGIVAPEGLIVDAKSGVSGAGRSLTQPLLFNETAEGMRPYSVNQHRHMAELHQEIVRACSPGAEAETQAGTKTETGPPPAPTFVPHLVPQRRGMITTVYARLRDSATAAQARDCLAGFCADEPFLILLPEGEAPTTHGVRGSNHCHMALVPGGEGQLIVLSALDNLVKGASGQALQNANLMVGLPETQGLTGPALFP